MKTTFVFFLFAATMISSLALADDKVIPDSAILCVIDSRVSSQGSIDSAGNECDEYFLSTTVQEVRSIGIWDTKTCKSNPKAAAAALDNLNKLAQTLKSDGVCKAIVNNINSSEI
jgi:hypothetical protein